MNYLEPAVPEKKKYHHGDLREQLLEAVTTLVEEHGPEGFSLAQACRRAGVSTAAPYKHFKDRTEIMQAVILRAMGRMRSQMQAAADAHPARDPRRIVALGQAYVDFARAEPGMFQAIFGLAEGPNDSELLNDAGDRTGSIVKHVVADHRGEPVDSQDVEIRAYILWCFVHGHSFLYLDDKVPFELSGKVENHMLRIVGDAILPT
ncbi:MAG: TetR/AcrR family transcriptional regulator [Pseudomonadota bacterium]